MQQALSHQALSSASGRFASIQSLISAISSAADQKGILDLQARISAELACCKTSNSRCRFSINPRRAAGRSAEQAREQVIDGHGSFNGRFQPVPDRIWDSSHILSWLNGQLAATSATTVALGNALEPASSRWRPSTSCVGYLHLTGKITNRSRRLEARALIALILGVGLRLCSITR